MSGAGTGHPVLVRGVPVAVVHILLGVELGRHVLDAPQTQILPSKQDGRRDLVLKATECY